MFLEMYAQAVEAAVELIDKLFAQLAQLSYPSQSHDPLAYDKHIQLASEIVKQKLKIVSWVQVASRDLIMSLDQIRQALKGRQPRLCPILEASIDFSKLKEASRAFAKHFNDIEDLRNSVAHSAEHLASVGQIDKHRVEGSAFERGSIRGRCYVSHVKGKKLTLELSVKTAEQARDIANLVKSAYQNARHCIDEDERAKYILKHPELS